MCLGQNIKRFQKNNFFFLIYFVLKNLYFIQEERRRQAAAAAEQRQRESDGRGLKDPEGYKRKVEQREKIEREAAMAGGGDGPLKVRFQIKFDSKRHIQIVHSRTPS